MSTSTRWNDAGTRLMSWLAVGLLVTGLAACDDEGSTTAPEEDPTLTTLVRGSSSLTTLDAALGASGLDATLDGDGPFTVFAPNDQAFAALGDEVVAALVEPDNAALLERVLTYHVAAGAAVRSTDLSDGQTVSTVQGNDLTIGISGGTVTVNGAEVVLADVEARNGVAHIIDGVLVPPVNVVERATLTAETQTLVDAVVQADLAATLSGEGPFTVFAPTNAAFEALESMPSGDALAEVLTYHVVPGMVGSGDLSDGMEVTTVQGQTFTVNIGDSGVTITDAAGNTVSVTVTDVPATNGVIHLIDGVLLPG